MTTYRPASSEENTGLLKAVEAAQAVNGLVAIPLSKDPDSHGTDFNDLCNEEGPGRVKALLDSAQSMADAETSTEMAKRHNSSLPMLRAVTIHELLQNEFPERESLLHPILHTQSLNMVHAWRGLGKTHFGLGVAYAVASGGMFLKWKAPCPRGVLYLDGEMPGNALQERLAAIVASNSEEPTAGYFRIVTPDLQEPGNIPDLSTLTGQAAIDALVTPDTALIVVDNLSCLCRSGRENEAESWIPVQGWALRHRAAGRSVLFIHHSGKNGEQRGNSKKEDVLDMVLKLKRPIDYEPSQGACFEVIFEKARHLVGDDTTSFEASLTSDASGKQFWVFKDVLETTFERVIELANEGLSQREIADELEINKSTVSRHMRKAREEGKLERTAK
jgi:putative DNA primase/helicase